jgi:hypothetical protein
MAVIDRTVVQPTFGAADPYRAETTTQPSVEPVISKTSHVVRTMV